MRFTNLFLMLFVISIISSGCSSGSDSPSIPQSPQDISQPISDQQRSSHNLLGAWTLDLNKENLECSLAPIRIAQSHWNVTSYIPYPQLTVINFDSLTGILDVDATITNTYNLDGYDLRLIVFTDNSGNRLLNADNWTALYDIPGGSVINPFKAYASGGVNRIIEGLSSQTQRIQMFFPAGISQVSIAIDVSFPGNCEEPFEIRNFFQNRSMFETVGSDCEISVNVYDWQSDIDRVQLYCPSITGEMFVDFSEITESKWGMTLANSTGTLAGNYLGFIAATSEGSGNLTLYHQVEITVRSSTGYGEITGEILSPECPVSVVDGRTVDFIVFAESPPGCEPVVLYEIDWDYDGVDYTPDAQCADGVFNDTGPYFNPNCPVMEPFSYTVAFRATDSSDPPNSRIFAQCEAVVDVCCGLITGSITSPGATYIGTDGEVLDFTVHASSSNDGDPIVLYEADFDFDGETFDIDDTSYDGIFDPIVLNNPMCPTSNPYSYTAAFRATDSCNPPNTTLFATCLITVDTCCGPITGSILSPSCPVITPYNGAEIDFHVTASSDNGGNPIIAYQADWDYKGVFTVDAFNSTGIFNDIVFTNPNCPTPDPKIYTVAFRAVDVCDPPNNTIFASCQVTVDDCLGIFGNLKLKVNRDNPNNYGYPIDPDYPWTLSWGPSDGVAEYAIYYDDDPTDGFDNDLQFVDVTTELEYTVPISHLPSDHYVVGNTYIVKARSETGNPLSEYDTSEPAFIMVNGFETLTAQDVNGEGWYGNCERNVATYTHRFYVETGVNTAHGIAHLRLPAYTGYTNRWMGITKETPIVPDSSLRQLSFSAYYDVNGTDNDQLIVGTCSTQPSYGWATPSQLEWSSVDSSGGYSAFNNESTLVRAFFDGVPSSGSNSWRFTDEPHYYLFGGNLNMEGNPLDQYIAIEFIHPDADILTTLQIDEIAIVVY